MSAGGGGGRAGSVRVGRRGGRGGSGGSGVFTTSHWGPTLLRRPRGAGTGEGRLPRGCTALLLRNSGTLSLRTSSALLSDPPSVSLEDLFPPSSSSSFGMHVARRRRRRWRNPSSSFVGFGFDACSLGTLLLTRRRRRPFRADVSGTRRRGGGGDHRGTFNGRDSLLFLLFPFPRLRENFRGR